MFPEKKTVDYVRFMKILEEEKRIKQLKEDKKRLMSIAKGVLDQKAKDRTKAMEVGKALNVLAKRFSFIAPIPILQASPEKSDPTSENASALPMKLLQGFGK